MKLILAILLIYIYAPNIAQAQDVASLTEGNINELYQDFSRIDYSSVDELSNFLVNHFHDDYVGVSKVPFFDPISGDFDYTEAISNKTEVIEAFIIAYEMGLLRSMKSEIMSVNISDGGDFAHVDERGELVMFTSFAKDRITTFKCSDEVVLIDGIIQVLKSYCTESKPEYRAPAQSDIDGDYSTNSGSDSGGCRADKLINI